MTIDRYAPSPSMNGEPDITTAQPFPGCWVLTPRGEIDAYSSPALHDRLIVTLESGEVTRLVVDLGQTTFLDSSALGVLVTAMKKMDELGGRLDIVTPSSAISRIFEITSLDSVLNIHDTLEAALST